MDLTYVFYLSIIIVTLAVIVRWSSTSTLKLPPGPSSIPILGSVHHLALEFQERIFYDWGRKYGDLIYLRLFRTPVIVLNTVIAARDLLDKRSAKYSDRPRLVLLAELNGFDTSTPAMRYGERFRLHRKWHHEYMGSKSALAAYRPIQQREVHLLLRNLLNTPDAFREHMYRYVVAILLEITYGLRTFSMDDELVQLAQRAITASNEGGSPGSILVDFFPILKHIPTWLPGAGFKQRAKKCRAALDAWRKRGLEIVKDAMMKGEGSWCITARLLEAHKNPSAELLEDITAMGVDVYGAGTDTTFGTLASFFLAMARNPHVLRKAQAEFDRVVGRDRLPTFEDRDSLPYTNALLEELYRWNPGLPLGIPHRLMSDDEYRGYDIPGGCMVMPNIWGMSRDTSQFPNPEEFNPERHLLPDGTLPRGAERPSSFVFGFGRRVCPGQAFADASLWLAIANIIATFDILRPLDAAGQEYCPPAEFKPGFTSLPKSFNCRIVPRDERMAGAIRNLDA